MADALDGNVVSALRSTLEEDIDVGTLPRRLCQVCVEFFPVSGVSISLMSDALIQQVLCASDDTAAKLEELQFSRAAGPCIDAFTDGIPVLVGDLTDASETTRWPAFAQEANDLGARAIFAVPLQLGAIRLGVMDLYRETPGPLGADVVSEVLMAADMICMALLGEVGIKGEENVVGQWFDEMPSARAKVHQATGMLMARLDMTAQEALVRMRGRAFADGLMLSEVATAVVVGTMDIGRD